MNYIKTKDCIYKVYNSRWVEDIGGYTIYDLENDSVDIIEQADTIEELCDVIIVKTKDYRGFKGKIQIVDLRNASGTKEDLHKYLIPQMKRIDLFDFAYLGIETQKGLIYVAKMNNKGELELI